MTDREIYHGYGLSPIDAKGRVAIPAQLRRDVVINNGGGSEIAIMPSGDGLSLICFDKPYIKRLPELVEKDYLERKPAEPELTREFLQAEAVSTIETQPFDSSGRFILSSTLRSVIELGDLAFFYGAMGVIRIWRPEAALRSSTIPANTKKLLEAQLRERVSK